MKLSIIHKAALPVLVFTLAGCADDMLVDENRPGNIRFSDAVTFNPSVGKVKDADTRAAYAPYQPLVLHAENDTLPLYLHTYEHPLGGQDAYASSTRGMEVNDAEDLSEIHKQFSVMATMEATGGVYFPMQPASLHDGYNIWSTLSTQRWPGHDYLNFHAVAPAGHQVNLENPDYSVKNRISFGYTALKSNDGESDAEAQTDLLMAVCTINRPESKEFDYKAPMTFNHALSAIKFAIRDVLKGEVVSVAVRGVKSSGNCVYTAESHSENGKFVWSEQSGNETYCQNFNYRIDKDGNFDPSDESQDIVMNDGMPEKTFFLIPQQLTQDAEIEVKIRRDNVAPGTELLTLKGRILDNSVKEWKPGYEYVYTISTSSSNWVYVFDAEGNAAEGTDNIYVYSPNDTLFVQNGNTGYFSVRSYRYRANDPSWAEACPWTASHGGSYAYNIETGKDVAYPVGKEEMKYVTAEEWITDRFRTPLRGDGKKDKSYERHDLDFYAHFVTTNWKGDETMQAYIPYSGFSKDNPYDLSTFGGKRSRTTANCYVVDRGGWYMLPLVYGNAIKDGAANKSAYITRAAAGAYVLPVMLKHDDGVISDPKISVPYGAKALLMWQDAYNMVSDVGLATINGEKMLRFHIDPNSLQQGNAVVALTDKSGTVLWSWHIWATEHWIDKTTRLPHIYDTGNSAFNGFTANAVTKMRESGDVKVTYNQKNRTFWMSPYNIGWCDPKKVVYLKRKSDMTFVQYKPDGITLTGKTESLPIIQQGEVVDYRYGNNSYYQWGRKDPMLGFFNHEHDFKRAFGDRTPGMEDQVNITIGTSIRNPEIFYAGKGKSGSEYEDWLTSNFRSNLWNNHENLGINSYDDDNDHADMWSHTKTIYDPCPAGYMVPNAGVWHVIQKAWAKTPSGNTWSGGNWPLDIFVNKINGARIDDYNYKVWGQGNAKDAEAVFFSSTGNRWWTNDWQINGIGAGMNFGRNVSYAWSSRAYAGHNSYGMALGLDTDRETEGADVQLLYYVGGQFIGRRAMGRPVRAIREP